MLSNIQKNIIIRAVKIRMEHGEKTEDILASYAKLTDAEREEILNAICGTPEDAEHNTGESEEEVV